MYETSPVLDAILSQAIPVDSMALKTAKPVIITNMTSNTNEDSALINIQCNRPVNVQICMENGNLVVSVFEIDTRLDDPESEPTLVYDSQFNDGNQTG